MSELIKSTIQSQYANSPALLTFIEEWADAINQDVNIEQFKRLIWNVTTANSQGLDIWGRIVGVDRNVKTTDVEGEFFGFTEGFTPFDNAPFTGQGTTFGSYKLRDEPYRKLIMIKAMANIVNATAPNINKLLQYIFKDRGRSMFLITGHMTARYYFDFILSPLEKKIVFDLQLLPRPCGVLVEYLEMDSSGIFGFEEADYQPFNQGTFA